MLYLSHKALPPQVQQNADGSLANGDASTFLGYDAVRTDRWKYIRYREWDGMDELFDLREDPFEIRNLAGESSARPALETVRRELVKLFAQIARCGIIIRNP